jgi:hypothetical protein
LRRIKVQLLKELFHTGTKFVKVWMLVENNGCFGVWLKQNKVIV